jgi:lipoyl(octanoyl) transferase
MQVVFKGRCDYQGTFDAMRAFTEARTPDSADELWLCEHDPVYTQGIAGRDHHVHDAGGIPVVRSNRGGQVTYHGPGQVVAYPLVDLRRLQLDVRTYVHRLEQAALRLLEHQGITGHRVPGAPGVYVRTDDPRGHAVLTEPNREGERFRGLGKIAALGVKVTRHCAYHGLALNVAMDLEPFSRIDPCGHTGLVTIDLDTLGVKVSWRDAASELALRLLRQLAPASMPNPSDEPRPAPLESNIPLR